MWNDLRLLAATTLLGHYKADSYGELVANLLSSCQKLGCFVPLKILFLDYDQDILPESCGALTSEHGEYVHYYTSALETINQGK